MALDEDIFVQTYLKNYFTFKDLITLYKMIGRKRLLEYAKELSIEKRIRYLMDICEKLKIKLILKKKLNSDSKLTSTQISGRNV